MEYPRQNQLKLSHISPEGWQELLRGQLEKVISIEKQAVGQLRGGLYSAPSLFE